MQKLGKTVQGNSQWGKVLLWPSLGHPIFIVISVLFPLCASPPPGGMALEMCAVVGFLLAFCSSTSIWHACHQFPVPRRTRRSPCDQCQKLHQFLCIYFTESYSFTFLPSHLGVIWVEIIHWILCDLGQKISKLADYLAYSVSVCGVVFMLILPELGFPLYNEGIFFELFVSSEEEIWKLFCSLFIVWNMWWHYSTDQSGCIVVTPLLFLKCKACPDRTIGLSGGGIWSHSSWKTYMGLWQCLSQWGDSFQRPMNVPGVWQLHLPHNSLSKARYNLFNNITSFFFFLNNRLLAVFSVSFSI